MFAKLKDWRRISMRYDRSANFIAATFELTVACMMICRFGTFTQALCDEAKDDHHQHEGRLESRLLALGDGITGAAIG
jgi:hypothetical protein